MPYTPPAGNAVDFSFQGEAAYTAPAGNAIDFSFAASGVSAVIADGYTPADALIGKHGVAAAIADSYIPSGAQVARHGISATVADSYVPLDAISASFGLEFIATIADGYVPVDAIVASHGIAAVVADSFAPADALVASRGVSAVVVDAYTPADGLVAVHVVAVAIADSYTPADAIAAQHTNLLTELPSALDNYSAPLVVTVSQSGDYSAPLVVDVDYPSGDYSAPLVVTVTQSGNYSAPLVVSVLGTSKRWRDKVLLAGVDVSARITGEVMDEQNEGAAHIASFTLLPASGSINPYSYVGAAVTIDHIRIESTGEIALRRFTGKVHIPQYNPVDRTITFTCTDDLQNRCAALDRATLDHITGGRYSTGVQGEQENNWAYAQARMETVAGSLDAGRDGGLRVTNWDGLPVWKTFDLTNTIEGSIGQELPQRGNLINRIDATFEYRFSRLHRRTCNLRYEGDMAVIAANALPLLAQATVEAALESTGWEFFYGDGFGGSSGAGSALFAAGGEPVTPRINYVPYPEVYNLPGGAIWYQNETDTTCLGFQAGMYKRWAQSVTETYTLTVLAPESITQNGEIRREERGSLASEWDASAWENDRRAAPVLNSGDWYQTQDYAPDAGTAARDAAIQTLVDLCVVKIKGTHRSGRAWATTLMDTSIDVSRAIRINTTKVKATGKVVKVRNVSNSDKDAGYATTEFHIAPSGHGGIGLPEVTPTPNTPPDAPVAAAPASTVRSLFGQSLGMHVGGLASSQMPQDPDWRGWIVNVQGSLNVSDPGSDAPIINAETQKTERVLVNDPYSGGTLNPMYVAANAYHNTGFRAVMPAIEDDTRDNIAPAVTKTYEVPISADELELAA